MEAEIARRGTAMQVVLVMFRGEGERRSFSIVRDVTIIGRREDCDFRIPLSEISRKHCRLIKDGDALRAEDLGSSNGTYVNGVRVQESQLSPGDTLKVGSVVFVVQIDGVPAEDELLPSSPSESGSAMALSAPPDEHALLNPTAQSDAGHESDVHGSEIAARVSDGSLDGAAPTIDEAASPAGSDEYDPMAILGADPEDSTGGEMLDDDQIAEDLITELDSHDRAHPNKQA